MKKQNKKIEYPSFERHLSQLMKSKEFKKAYEEERHRLELSLKIIELRKKLHFSQQKLAKELGTTQSVIARIEAGKQNLTTDTLQKIASVFGRNVKIEFVK